MNGRNCPNCGAVLEIGKTKCPYCGTSYFDISAIPIDEPFYLTLSTKDGTKITAKVKTTGATLETETKDYCGGIHNSILAKYYNSRTLNMEFNILPSSM